MRIGVCPGSFDPITVGHLDIIDRAAKLFDKLIVLVVVNVDKSPSFSLEERMEMIAASTSHLGNVEVAFYEGLLVDYLKEVDAIAMVKGLRAVTDFEYEFQMALTNKKLYPEAETIFLTTSAENMYLSSSLVKQVARFGGDISHFVPSVVHDRIWDRLGE